MGELMIFKYRIFAAFIAFLVLSTLLFQNCGPAFKIGDSSKLTGEGDFSSSGDATCFFNGLTIDDGQTIKAFRLAAPNAGGACESETRTCNSGLLSGSFSESSCIEATPGSCVFNGNSVPSGAQVAGYTSPTVPSGRSCSEVATQASCVNGVLSSPVPYANCRVLSDLSCDFNGIAVPEGVAVTAYLNSLEPFGGSCVSEARKCLGGSLTGTYKNSSCVFAKAKTCPFNGVDIANGDLVQVYSAPKVAFGSSCSSAQMTLTCSNGIFLKSDGSRPKEMFTSCVPASTSSCTYTEDVNISGSTRIDVKTLASGQSVSGYASLLVPAGESCTPMQRTLSCDMGILKLSEPTGDKFVWTRSAPKIYPTCSPGACLIAREKTVADQTVFNGYSAPHVGFGLSCSSVELPILCSAGKLVKASDGSLATGFSSTCTPMTTSTCQYSDRTNFNTIFLQTGQSAIVYEKRTVPEGTSCGAVRNSLTCNLGILSVDGKPLYYGSQYFYPSCSVGGCVFSNSLIANGSSVSAFSSYNVPYGSSCSSVAQTLTCRNQNLYTPMGVIADSYVSTCSVVPGPSCSITNWVNLGGPKLVVQNGATDVGYSSSSGTSLTPCSARKLSVSCENGYVSVNGAAAKPAGSLGIFHFYSTCTQP